jgi:myo-inositol-1(or 4)-monophosphatase
MSLPANLLSQLAEVAKTACLAGGEILKCHYGRVREISYKDQNPKKSQINPVTNVDHLAEEAVLDCLRKQRPEDDILTEERSVPSRGSPFLWIIDPLDGTANFVHSYPRFCVSIGVCHAGVPVAAAICDPLLGELFSAARGQGAYLNGKAIRVSQTAHLQQALVATGFPYDRRERAGFYLRFYEAFLRRTQDVRRDGSAALNLAYTAAGRFDGYWEFGLSAWDIAAGWLLLEEAGGRVSNLTGGPCELHGQEILVSNGLVHDQMLAIISNLLNADLSHPPLTN